MIRNTFYGSQVDGSGTAELVSVTNDSMIEEIDMTDPFLIVAPIGNDNNWSIGFEFNAGNTASGVLNIIGSIFDTPTSYPIILALPVTDGVLSDTTTSFLGTNLGEGMQLLGLQWTPTSATSADLIRIKLKLLSK